MGTLGRQHLPGRADARAALLPASGAGLGSIPDADREPLYVRIGHASRRRRHGSSGPQRRCEDARGRSRMKTVAIIGGGHNGLAAAFYLAKAGLKTRLFEA